jgi:hypothetical protein
VAIATRLLSFHQLLVLDIMIRHLKRITIRNIVSPYGLAILSYCLFLFAWLFPPGLYTEYIREPDLMFLDPTTLLFYTACVVGFLFGVRASRVLGHSFSRGPEAKVNARRALLYLTAPLLVASLSCLIYLILLGGKINFIALLASQQGDAIKIAGQVGQTEQGRWGESITILTVVLWWSFFRASQLRVKGVVKVSFYLLFLPALAIGILTCVATVDRGSLMPILTGLLMIFLYRNTRGSNATIGRITTISLLSGTGVIAAFLALSFLRGALALRLLMTGLLGYTIVSYNRLTALLGGVMHYSYEGRGVYLSRYLLQDEKLNNVFHLADRFGWPNGFALWQTEFSSTMSAGLNPSFIWAGAFGYLYSDIGWWTPLYLFCIGVLAGHLWTQFGASKTFGLVLYPWMGFCILTWFGVNSILSVNIVQYSEVALVLYFYDKVFLYDMQETPQIDQDPIVDGHILRPFTNHLARSTSGCQAI